MQTFRMKEDNNRLYFRNFDWTLPEIELKNIKSVLKENGVSILDKKSMGIDDIYRCNKDDMQFDIIYTGEETFLYSDDEECIDILENLFEGAYNG